MSVQGLPSAETDIPSTVAPAALRVFLLVVLDRIRAGSETPLQFDLDAARIFEEAWKTLTASAGKPARWVEVRPWLDRLMTELLPTAGGQTRTWCGHLPLETGPVQWVHLLQAALRQADPQCAAVACLRAEGWPEREAARRCGLGARLFRHIAAAFHEADAHHSPTLSRP